MSPSLQQVTTQDVPIDQSKRTDDNHWLLPEIICSIFSFLDDTDLLAASGVNRQWYQVAAYVMKMRGKTLYRWPDDPPSSASTLRIVSVKGISDVLKACKGIKTLEIIYDEPSKISTEVIKQISCIEINKLLLRNVILNYDCAKELLKSEIQVVKIHSKRKNHVSRRSRRLLLENRELFRGLVISNDEPEASMIGIYPNPVCRNRCDTLHYSKVFLEATGLSDVRFGDALTSLLLSKGYHLKGEDLLRLSVLNLSRFSVVECTIPESGWSAAFHQGFQRLSSLSLIDCPYIGLETVRHIAAKPYLCSLKLDLRKLDYVAESISFLQDSVGLVTLKMICVGASEFSECMFLEKKWSKLEKIIIKNQDHNEMKTKILNNLIKKYKAENIVMTYYNNYTIGCSQFMVSKNLMPRTPI